MDSLVGSRSDRFEFFSFTFAAIARTVGHLSKSAEVMKLVNNLMKAPEVAVTMQEFSKEMTKVCLQQWYLLFGRRQIHPLKKNPICITLHSILD